MKKYVIRVNGKAYDVEVEEVNGVGISRPPTSASAVQAGKNEPEISPVGAAEPLPGPETPSVSSRRITSPMAGTIASIRVKAGDAVSQGDVLLVLEAMKMENDIMAATDGIIKTVDVAAGKIVNAGELLITLE